MDVVRPEAADDRPDAALQRGVRRALAPRGGGARRIGRSMLTVLVAGGAFVAGCRSVPDKIVARPARHSVRAERFTVLTNFKLPKDHALISELEQVQQQVTDTLKIPVAKRSVAVYIFEDETEYRQFLEASFPGLPPRRAYFIGTPQELAVYTFWGERIQEDLRHEFTHGLLHASLKTVPLWLDEGLAEYFEVPGKEAGGVHREYAARLAQGVGNGWRPDLPRLERLETVSHMQRADYQESWAWVHFLLHGSDDGRGTLLAYLDELRRDGQPAPLSERIRDAIPDADGRLVNYVGTLQSRSTVAGAVSLSQP